MEKIVVKDFTLHGLGETFTSVIEYEDTLTPEECAFRQTAHDAIEITELKEKLHATTAACIVARNTLYWHRALYKSETMATLDAAIATATGKAPESSV